MKLSKQQNGRWYKWVLLGIALSGASAQAKDPPPEQHFWVRVPSFTPATPEACAERARALGEEFARVAGEPSATGRCLGVFILPAEGRNYPQDSIEVTYSSERPVSTYTALIGGADHGQEPLELESAYDRFDDCLQDRDPQSQLYARMTGLVALAASCEPSTSLVTKGYILRIVGLGMESREPAARLFVAKTRFYGETTPEFRRRTIELLTRQGGVVSHSRDERVLYYAPRALPFSIHQLSGFAEAAACEGQLGDFEALFKRGGARSVVSACLPIAPRGGASPRFILAAAEDSGQFILGDFGLGGPRYYSLQECLTDRPRRLRDLAVRKTGALGGICHEAGAGLFVLDVFESLRSSASAE